MKFLQQGILIFVIALCGNVWAQTTVCSGDSVVVVLGREYRQGSTTWEQSTDQTNWSPAQGTQYNDSLVITATNTFYYRAKVIEGTCDPFYSDTVLVTVRLAPPPPVVTDATGVTLLSFQANWTASAGATTYYLDVATDAGFTSFVVGYNNHKVDNDTTYSVTGVSCNTTYYYHVRVYDDTCGITSTNSNTITVTTLACPPAECTYKSTCSGNITDTRDSKIYKTIQIGTQCWMAQNLNVGTAIPGVVQQTNNTILEKYCYDYGGYGVTPTDSSKCATYGGLYRWGEMMAYGTSDSIAPGPQGICPTGWHIPVDSEWTCLEKTLGGAATAGNKLKTKGNGVPPLWQSGAGTDTSHFSALPSGEYSVVSFNGIGFSANFWTATESDATNVWYRGLNTLAQVYRYSGGKALGGYSVRCVKD